MALKMNRKMMVWCIAKRAQKFLSAWAVRLQFLPPDGEGFLHPSRNNLELEVSAAEWHCCLLLL